MTWMTCSDAELRGAGWNRCFIADEPRLSEAVETYRDIGFEVLVVPVRADDAACTECMRARPDAFRVIYVRKPVDSCHEPEMRAPGLESGQAVNRES